MPKTITDMDYYYNRSPGQTPWRNNLIYTSLISSDKKVFCQWYFNDGIYHKDQNQVIDPSLMQIKWEREVYYLLSMSKAYPDLVPNILDIDYENRKIFLEVDGVDFWQRSLDRDNCSFDEILPDWQDQMLNIVKAHRNMGYYKYSMHPSSYFIVNNKLKSINYFFTYNKDEGPIKISDHLSHIYSTRQEEMRKYTDSLGISWNTPQPLDLLEQLCWDSFRSNYPIDFIEKVKCI
jgi:hypothetical protein